MAIDLDRIAVSPNFTATKLRNPKLADKIDVFEDQVKGWLFNHADVLVSERNPQARHCGLAVLMIVGSYFESIASFLCGESSEGKSGKFFAIGLEDVFPEVRSAAVEEDPQNIDKVLSDFARTFYSELRCGIFHEAMVRGKIVIRQGETAVAIIVNTGNHSIVTIFIDPVRFLGQFESHFARYVEKLRNQEERELRERFEMAWDERLNRPGAVIPIQLFS